jgi:hypothetical protein
MTLPEGLEGVSGAQELFDWFGYWPSFHDAELLSLNLNRKGVSTLRIHTWEMTKEVDAQGFYKLAKHVLVEIALERIAQLSLEGFSHQNVIFGLSLEHSETGYLLNLEDCYGLSGSISAERVSVSLKPGKPPEGT